MNRTVISIATLLLLAAAAASADDVDAEVEHLIGSIEVSECSFIRNGKRHDAKAAADHLRMKYRRGKKYARTAEQFIGRLASKSSMSGKPYFIDCPGQERQKSGTWLSDRLAAHRRATDDPGSQD